MGKRIKKERKPIFSIEKVVSAETPKEEPKVEPLPN